MILGDRIENDAGIEKSNPVDGENGNEEEIQTASKKMQQEKE